MSAMLQLLNSEQLNAANVPLMLLPATVVVTVMGHLRGSLRLKGHRDGRPTKVTRQVATDNACGPCARQSASGLGEGHTRITSDAGLVASARAAPRAGERGSGRASRR